MKKTMTFLTILMVLLFGRGILELNAQVSSLPLEDAVTYKHYPDSAKNHTGNLFAYKLHTDTLLYSYIKFDISHLAGKVIENPRIILRGGPGASDSLVIKFHNVKSENWIDSTLTWNNKPAHDKYLGELEIVNGQRVQSSSTVDFNTKLNEAIRNGQTTFSVRLISAGNDSISNSWLGSKENGATYIPELQVDIAGASGLVIEDAVAFKHYPDSAKNHTGNLYAYKLHTDTMLYSYIKFDISHLAGKVIENPRIVLRGGPGASDSLVIKFHNVKSENWIDSTLTWNNKPAHDKYLGELEIVNGQRVQSSSTTDFVTKLNEAIRNGQNSFSVRLISAGNDSISNSWIGSKENGKTYTPELLADIAGTSGLVIEDAAAYKHYPDSAKNHTGNLFAYKLHADTLVYSYVKFDISHLAGKNVENPRIVLRGGPGASDSLVIKIHNVKSETWIDSTLTWNNKPAHDKLLGELEIVNGQRVQSSSTTDFVTKLNEAIRDGKTTFSVRLSSAGNDSISNSWIGSKENGKAYIPELMADIAGASGLPVEDAIAFKHYPDSAKNHIGNLFAYKLHTDTIVYSYIKFDIKELAGKYIENPRVVLRGGPGASDSLVIKIHNVKSETWIDSTLTWNNKPAHDKLIGELEIVNGQRVQSSSTTDFVTKLNEAIRAGRQTFSVRLISAGNDSITNSWIGSMENGKTYTPELIVDDQPQDEIIAPVFNKCGVTFWKDDLDYRNTVSLLSNHGALDTVYYTIDGTEPDNTSEVFPAVGIYINTNNLVLKGITYRYNMSGAVIDMSDITTCMYNVKLRNLGISPGAQQQFDSVEVTITGEDEGIAIYYTLDGSDPSMENGMLYEGPFTLYDTTTVKAIGYLEDFEPTNIASRYYEPAPSYLPPVITPTEQQQYSPLTVTIEFGDQLMPITSETAIYYNINSATPPTKDDIKYDDPFALEVTTPTVYTIQAVVYGGDTDPRYSDVAIQSYLVSPPVGIEMFTITGVEVYPNPVTNELKLKNLADFGDKVTVSVIDLNGRTVLINDIDVQNSDEEFSINMTSLQSGYYHLKLVSEDNTAIVRIVKK